MPKRYFECPAEQVPFEDGFVYRPLLAEAVETTGGAWAVVETDSDTQPTSFIVCVSNRRSREHPFQPGVWLAIAGNVASATELGRNFGQAVAAARSRFGAVRANRMRDQVVGDE